MIENYRNLTIKDVLTKLEFLDSNELDTDFSQQIFAIEEGAQDVKLKTSNSSNQGRRDWIVLWEIYGSPDEQPNQNFHLKNYLEFRLKNGLNEDENFVNKCYRHIRNAALILYIREVIFGETSSSLQDIVDALEKHYVEKNQVNSASLIAKS